MVQLVFSEGTVWCQSFQSDSSVVGEWEGKTGGRDHSQEPVALIWEMNGEPG